MRIPTKTVIVDSDAIFALYNPNDPLNVQATKTFERLITKEFQIIYPTSVIFEIISLFQRVLPTPGVNTKLIGLIRDETIRIALVDGEILKEAAKLFDPAGSKRNTLVDCSVVAIARKLKANGVFSYDEFYRQQGLRLAGDLVK